MTIMTKLGLPLLAAGLTSLGASVSAETIPIAVGHQSMCTDTYTEVS